MAASYESAAGIESVFADAAAAGGVSQTTANAISQLIGDLQTSGSTVAVTEELTSITAENAAAVTAPIVMMGENTSVNATFGANSEVQAIILDKTSEASNITFDTAKDVTVQLGGATGDVVTTGAGSDSVTFTGGSATVDTGAGNDTIVIQGDGELNIKQSGSGDLSIRLETVEASATIDAGDGFDKLRLQDSRDHHSFEVVDGKFVMHSDNAITMEGVNVVLFNGANGPEDISILASTEGQAVVGRLYKVALGREAIDFDASVHHANVDGLNFWLDTYEGGIASNADATAAQLDQVYQAILACDEFTTAYAGMTDEQFVQKMMGNMGSGVTTVNGITAAEYAAQLAAGTITRADLAIDFAQSAEAVAAMGIDGTGYVIEGF